MSGIIKNKRSYAVEAEELMGCDVPTLGCFRVVRSGRDARARRPLCDSPARAVAYWRREIATSEFYHEGQEQTVVLVLDARSRIMGWRLVFVGSASEVHFHPREILRPVLLAGGWGFIVMHNHPSGDASPSNADRACTRQVWLASSAMGVRMVDHVIVGDRGRGSRGYCSLGEHGVMPGKDRITLEQAAVWCQEVFFS